MRRDARPRPSRARIARRAGLLAAALALGTGIGAGIATAPGRTAARPAATLAPGWRPAFPAPPGGIVPEAAARYGAADAPMRLRVRGAADIDSFGPALAGFVARRPDIAIDFEQWNSNALALQAAAACRGEAPGSDLIVSSAVDLQLALVDHGCAQPWRSEVTGRLGQGRRWRNELFGLTREPAAIIYNRRLVPEDQAPLSRFALLDALARDPARYRGKVATYDIRRSGVGYVMAFSDSLRSSTFGRLVQAFRSVGAEAACCSAEIIDGVARGRWLVAYNVLGSYALRRAEAEPDLRIVLPQDYTLMLSRAAFIPRGADHALQAGALIDHLLGPEGQGELRRQGLVWPGASAEPDTAQDIALTPVLLLGLDREKRRRMLSDWTAGAAEAEWSR